MELILIYGTLDDFWKEYPRMNEILRLAVENKNDVLVRGIHDLYLVWATYSTQYAISKDDWLRLGDEQYSK